MSWVPTINPEGYSYSDGDVYRVVISKPGPRGGKRPPLFEKCVRALSYSEAVRLAEANYLSTTTTEVTCPA